MQTTLRARGPLKNALISAPIFARALETHGAQIAIVSHTTSLTYTDLANAADSFAQRLMPNVQLVLIEGRNEMAALVAYLGALRSGRVVLMHPPGQDIDASEITRTFAPDARYFCVGDEWVLEQTAYSTPCHADLALLLSTSGTTGATKLVRLSAAALEANALSIAEYLGLTATEKPITTLPIHYSYGLSVINSHLAVGATILLTDDSVVDDAFWDLAVQYGATSLAGVPRTYELLERGALLSRAPKTLRMLTQAGGRLAPSKLAYPLREIKERGGQFFVMYGQTEATARIAYVPPHLLQDNKDCIGIAIPNGEIELRDDNGHKIDAVGKSGELIYRGPNIMMGYAQSPEDLQRGHEMSELATGDIAERNSSGLFRIVGRRSRFVKPFGLRVALDEIEKTLEGEGVQSLVAGTDDLIAIAVKDSDAKDIWDSKRQTDLCARLSEHYRLPQKLFHILPMNEWPSLPNGKPDYASLVSQAQKSLRRLSDSPKTVSALFADIFLGMPVDDDSSFESLGGDSLNYVELATGLEAILGELPKNWDRLSLRQLELLRSTAGDQTRGWFSRAGIDPDVALRATAIAAIVFHHAAAFEMLAGGVAALLLMVGYNWARFQRSAIIAGSVWRILPRLFAAVLAPYFLVVAAFEIARGGTPLSAWFLFANYDVTLHGFMLPFWFVSAYAQATLLLVLLSSAGPGVRNAVKTSPWRLGMIAVGIGLIAKAGLFELGLSVPFRSLDQVVPQLALGWTLAFSDTRRRQVWAAIAACAVAVSSILGDDSLFSNDWSLREPYWMLQAMWILIATLGILYVPRLSVPRWSAATLSALAAGAFTIYLTHTAVIWVIGRAVGDPIPGAAAGVAALLVGLTAHFAVHRGARLTHAACAKKNKHAPRTETKAPNDR